MKCLVDTKEGVAVGVNLCHVLRVRVPLRNECGTVLEASVGQSTCACSSRFFGTAVLEDEEDDRKIRNESTIFSRSSGALPSRTACFRRWRRCWVLLGLRLANHRERPRRSHGRKGKREDARTSKVLSHADSKEMMHLLRGTAMFGMNSTR